MIKNSAMLRKYEGGRLYIEFHLKGSRWFSSMEESRVIRQSKETMAP